VLQIEKMRANKEIIVKTGRRKSEFTRAEIRRLIRDIFGNGEPAKKQASKTSKKVKPLAKNKKRVTSKHVSFS